MSAEGEWVWVQGDPRPSLLEAFARGRYARQVGFRTDNPYRDDEQMAEAWNKGWESVACASD